MKHLCYSSHGARVLFFIQNKESCNYFNPKQLLWFWKIYDTYVQSSFSCSYLPNKKENADGK